MDSRNGEIMPVNKSTLQGNATSEKLSEGELGNSLNKVSFEEGLKHVIPAPGGDGRVMHMTSIPSMKSNGMNNA